MLAGQTYVASRGARLLATMDGDPAAPTVVLVHGYPDTHRVWDEVVRLLRERFHVVAYDTRGTGRSSAPAQKDAFALHNLTADIEAVIDAVSPERPVHLVGHDWGAFQCWDAVTTARVADRIASFTAVAGPRIDQMRPWIRARLRFNAKSIKQLAGQARRSWYIAAFQIPRLPEALLARMMERAWPRVMRRLEHVEPRDGHPAATLVRDAQTGLALYRTNMRGYLHQRAADAGRVNVPVQIVIATGDRYISPALYDDAERWAESVWRRELDAGHWVQRSHPGEVARYITELVEHAEGAVAPQPTSP
jgi:pimeloyl-ACP methyl ester carboxylesterase